MSTLALVFASTLIFIT